MCNDFRNGLCSRGNSCRFLHELWLLPPVQRQASSYDFLAAQGTVVQVVPDLASRFPPPAPQGSVAALSQVASAKPKAQAIQTMNNWQDNMEDARIRMAF